MKMIIFKYILVILAFAMFYSCAKSDGITNQTYSTYGVNTTQGLLKVNLAFAYYVDLSTLMIKINNSVVGSALQQRTPFPGGGYNTRGSNYALYLSVPQGNDTVSVVIPKTGTNTDSVVLYKTVVNIPDSSAYTLHITDTLVNVTTNNTKSLLVKNEISNLDTGFCRFKFVNLIPNVAAVDLYLNGILMKSNIGYLTATDSFRVATGVNAPGYSTTTTTTWAVRKAGALSTSTALASYASSNGLLSQSVMTIFCMGYSGITGTRLPYICYTLDKNQ